METKKTKEIDENLYSRQLYVLGMDAMKRMANSDVLICGMNGIGVELAKNVILSGVKSVYLYDPKPVTWMDLSSQFFLNEDSIGSNRVDGCLSKLKELNEYVKVEKVEGELNETLLKRFSVVVFCDHFAEEVMEYNSICHENNVKFILIENLGLSGTIFCDFGKGFEVLDVDGEPLVTNIITSITNEKEAIVFVHEDKRTHGYYDGDLVVFDGVKGMEEINNLPPAEVVSTGKHTFRVKIDTTEFGEYKLGGTVTQVKKPKIIDFKQLKDSIEEPEFVETGKFGAEKFINELFRACYQFKKQNGFLPKPYNLEDAEKIINLLNEKRSSKKIDLLDKEQIEIAKKFSFTCRGNLNPMVTLLAGFGGQEVLKAVSGKFHPIQQWLFIDSFESFPDKIPEEKDCKEQNCRYDGQIVVFGNEFQEKLKSLKYFIVGAGALGCEYLKNFAMMGIGSGKKGKLFLTDLDSIEVSNLNRQFLFRRKHVGKMKSEIAGKAAIEMNNDLNIEIMQDKVAPETEGIFNDNFWENLDGVTNALDNITARLYVDSKCVYHKKPLIEAGTLGTKANLQIVVPNLTESYSSTPDPQESFIPICTLKNFPNDISHCIQWGRDLFQGLFKNGPQDVNRFLSSQNYIKDLEEQGGSIKQNLENIFSNLNEKPLTFDDCIIWARNEFEKNYNWNIKQLLYNFPPDMITSSGGHFWGGPKRPPTPITFNPKDKLHIEFIVSAANLRAEIFGIKQYRYDYNYELVLNNMKVNEFIPKDNVKIKTDEKSENENENENEEVMNEDAEIEKLKSQLPKPSEFAGFKLKEIEFEKDDDTNFHIDFITAASNLRARNYKIPEADKHKTKGIAGKIIPAMITTTALITGFGSLELYKLVHGKKKLEDYKNSFINIAIPLIAMGDPIKAPEIEMNEGKKWTLWDKFDIDAGKDITMGQLFAHFKNKHKLAISMMTCGKAILYSFFGNQQVMKDRLKTPLIKVIENVTKETIPKTQKYANFEICCTDLNDDDVDVPPVKYKLYL